MENATNPGNHAVANTSTTECLGVVAVGMRIQRELRVALAKEGVASYGIKIHSL